jgi:hypothetical protein
VVQTYLRKTDGWLWTPVETGATHAGVPDSFWAHTPTQTCGWIEHKATNGWAVTVRPHQLAWIGHHTAAGVNCLFLVRAGGAGSAKKQGDSLWAVAGSHARALAENGLDNVPVLGRWYGAPADWDWRAIRATITGK